MVKPHRCPLKAASSIVTDQINGATVVTIREVWRGCRERRAVGCGVVLLTGHFIEHVVAISSGIMVEQEGIHTFR
uniref:Uncharacterized protein n=1 Tax=Oryza meridionalis TaxID=40149 RepID=A0A0E0DR13_9ORYZ